MRIDVRIAMPGEMLCRCDNVLTLNSLDECRPKFTYRFRVFPKRPNVYHRIVGIVIYI